MSTVLYGAISQRREATPPATDLHQGPPEAKVSHWQDIAAGLVPAEVLAVHAVAMSFGTTRTAAGDVRISHPGEMMAVYAVMLALSVVLYVFGGKRAAPLDWRSWQTWVRALTPAAAFVIWTMVQPGTAFDAFPFELSTFLRTMIAVIGALLLGVLVNAMAGRADTSAPH